MPNPLNAYYGWMMRTADRLPGSWSANMMLLWGVPFFILAVPLVLFSRPDGGIVLTDWRTVELSPPALAGWCWLLGSMAWAGYSLWRLAWSWARAIRAGWRNQPLPPADD